MEVSPGGIGENKEIPQSVTSFSWPRMGLDLSNRSLEFYCYIRSLSRRAMSRSSFAHTKKGFEHRLESKRTRKTANFLRLNVNISDGVMRKSSGNWAAGTRRCTLMLSCNNNTQQQGYCSTLDVINIMWWNVNDTL